MKIAIVVYSFLPKYVAGTEIATYNIAKGLSSNSDYDINVLTSLDEGLPSESEMDGFKVHRIYRPWKNNSIGLLFSAPLFWIMIFFKIWRLKPDIVHFQGLSTGIIGIFSKTFLKIPYIVWARGSDVYLANPLIKITHEMIFNKASAIIALTEYMKNAINQTTDKEVHVIPNGVELNKFAINENKEDTRCKLGIPQDKTILIFVGRLYAVKGVDYLIKSLNILKKDFNNFKLLILGDGPEMGNLRQLSQELGNDSYIEFLGRIPNEKVSDYLNASDIFVLPSLSEGFPNVLLEAMACGLPVISTNIRGLDEIIIEGRNGFLINPKSPEEIAHKVEYILDNPLIFESFSQNNKNRAKKYEWKMVINKLDEIYKKALE